jgi:hypothetical protein
MTWPWFLHLRDACADKGDPYLHSWVMWWDYHQTFHDPLHLFDGNIFYPLRYTLAFSENDYGIALLFSPLYALGLRPLTINSLATFLGFAFCGYGALRLTRTLTRSNTAGWVAGIVFAFTPYRFHVLSQITYVFAGWLPLTLEALVLFARERSRKRAAWLGIAFTMNALSSLTFMTLSLLPLVLSALALMIRHRLWRDRAFWFRGGSAALASILALIPFVLPYLYVSKVYGFTWGPEVVARNSPTAIRWLVAEYRNRLWKGFGDNLPGGGARMFPGLLAPLLALAAALLPGTPRSEAAATKPNPDQSESLAAKPAPPAHSSAARWVVWLDGLAVVAAIFAVLSLGWAGSVLHPVLGRFFAGPTFDRALMVLAGAVGVRLSLAYPALLRRADSPANLIEHIRDARRGEVFWLGAIWATIGFLMSLGTNSWLYRVLFNLVFIFRSMREPSRAAMIACLGIAVLSGAGAVKLTEIVASRHRRFASPAIAAIVLALIFELNAAPMRIERGAPDPDELTLRLKNTPMKGGLVELPTGGAILPHLYMLRAADHERPLVNATSTFVPPHAWEIERLSNETPIPPKLLDNLEAVPTSYLVIHNPPMDSVRRKVYESFLSSAVAKNRLRFIRRYGEGDDLYAVVKTEPDARSEMPPPFTGELRDWGDSLAKDPLSLLEQPEWSQLIYRMHLASEGRMPRFANFLTDMKIVARGVTLGMGDQDSLWDRNVHSLADALVRRPAFIAFGGLNNDQFVNKLAANAGISLSETERSALVAALNEMRATRGSVLLQIAENRAFVEQERNRSFVALHYFAYLHRNPGDPPDRDFSGFNFWVREFARDRDPGRLSLAFRDSIEYRRSTAQK